jgi:hypothetical protein
LARRRRRCRPGHRRSTPVREPRNRRPRGVATQRPHRNTAGRLRRPARRDVRRPLPFLQCGVRGADSASYDDCTARPRHPRAVAPAGLMAAWCTWDHAHSCPRSTGPLPPPGPQRGSDLLQQSVTGTAHDWSC